jgi:hypothetical protein
LLLEIGLLLVLVPWSRFWERNYFADLVPLLQVVITNNYVRGAISGLGLINLWYAFAELSAVMADRSRETPASTNLDG